jgi:hypothetical protein
MWVRERIITLEGQLRKQAFIFTGDAHGHRIQNFRNPVAQCQAMAHIKQPLSMLLVRKGSEHANHRHLVFYD